MNDKPPSEVLSPPRLGAAREKYWKELTDAEKIERLHMVVKQLMNRADAAQIVADDAHRIAEDHQHAASGVVMVPANLSNRRVSESPRRTDNEYF